MTAASDQASRTGAEFRRARFAILLAFVAVGFLLAVWLVHIPQVRERTGLSHDALGFTLLALGAGSFAAMQCTGLLIARFGAKRVVVAGVTTMALTLMLPGVAWDGWSLATALFCFGIGNGLCEVAMNAEAVEIETDMARPIMSSFHAMWSVGTALGAGLGALLQLGGIGLLPSFLCAAALGICVAAVIAVLLPARPLERFGARETPPGERRSGGAMRLRILILGVLAFLLLLAEGTANDWSALHAVERFSVDPAAAALAYGTFAVAMTVARLGIDRVVGMVGPANVVRFGSLVAAAGLTVVMVAPSYAVALAGWAILAFGLSGIVPQIFTAAGNLPVANRPVVLSRVVGAGYLGLLAGPAVIGWLAEASTLNLALVAPVIMCVFGAVAASAVAPTHSREAAE